jgi:hypothetical protein
VSEHLDFLTLMLKDAVFAEQERELLHHLKAQLKERWQVLPVSES